MKHLKIIENIESFEKRMLEQLKIISKQAGYKLVNNKNWFLTFIKSKNVKISNLEDALMTAKKEEIQLLGVLQDDVDVEDFIAFSVINAVDSNFKKIINIIEKEIRLRDPTNNSMALSMKRTEIPSWNEMKKKLNSNYIPNMRSLIRIVENTFISEKTI